MLLLIELVLVTVNFLYRELYFREIYNSSIYFALLFLNNVTITLWGSLCGMRLF